MNPTIDLERLADLLDTYGPDPARFPEAEREAAAALIASDPSARALLLQATALANALDALPAPVPSATLQRAVAEIPLRAVRTRGAAGLFAWLPFRSASSAALSAVLIVLLGVLSGVWSESSRGSTDTTSSVAAADDFQDLSALTYATELDQELQP